MSRIRSIRLLGGATIIQFTILGLTLLNSVVVSRALGVAGRGYYQVILTAAMLATSIGGLSIEHSLARAFANDRSSRQRLMATGVYGSLILGGVIGLATTGLILLTNDAIVPRYPATGLVVLALLVPTLLFGVSVQRLLFLQGRPLMAASVQLGGTALALALTAVLALSHLLTPVGATVIVLVGSALSGVWGGLTLRPHPHHFEWPLLLRILASGARFHPGQLGLVLLVRLDVLILSGLTSLKDVGVYAVAVSVTAPIGVFATTITTTFLASQFDGEDADAPRRAVRLMHLTFLSTFALVAITAVAAPFLIPAVWGSDFAPAVVPALLLLPGVVAMSIQRPIGNYFVRRNMYGALNVRSLLAISLNVGLCFALIPRYGVSGASVASTVAYLLYASISITYFLRSTHFSVAALISPPTTGSEQRNSGASESVAESDL